VLIDLEPDSWYSAWRFFDAATGAFLRWYVNFQVPFRRSAVGFDTLDLFLDLEITPDLVSRDKDLDDYEQALRLGLFGDDVRTAVDRARREVLRRVERTAYPFRGIDTEWRPEAGWGPAELPERCDVEVVTTDEWSPPRT
jgi:predicted RNA-binding protein associated with RNAse of E/G family